MDNYKDYAKELSENYEKFIYDIEDECQNIANRLIPLVCRRAIRRMNSWKGEDVIDGHKFKWEGKDALLDGDYPKSFTFFDILSIQIQNFSYDEINPYLHDAIVDMLWYEVSLLSHAEQFVMEHSYIVIGNCGKCECDRLHLESELCFCFSEMLNKHCENTKKIRNHIE